MKRVIKLLIALIYFSVQRVIRVLLLLIDKHPPSTLVVLCYHSVKKKHLTQFAKQVKFALQKAVPVASNQNSPIIPHRHHVVFTFDDSYTTFMDNVLPILENLDIPATLFVPTSFCGTTAGWIKDWSHKNYQAAILSPDDLRSLPEALVQVGTHTHTHCRLAEMNFASVKWELVTSKNFLEEILGREVNQMALPYGSWSSEVTLLAKEAGYKRIFRNIPLWTVHGFDGLVMGRVTIEPEDWPIEYHLKILGAYKYTNILVAINRALVRRIFSKMSHKAASMDEPENEKT